MNDKLPLKKDIFRMDKFPWFCYWWACL